MSKICKGTGKCKGNGCGVKLPYTERNGLKTYKAKFGLGIDCGCYYKFNNGANKVKPINKRSKKRIAQEIVYSKLRKVFLNKDENKICPITKELATEVHHKKGRIGELLNDTKYWVALSHNGHEFVENNPIWAKENGYSLNRLDND